jgi:MarR family transcriptional regulator, negative regulator of the multidrug operon emrRAB
VGSSAEARLANLLGAASTGVADAMEEAMLAVAGLDGSAPAALVAFLDFSPHGSVRALSEVVGLTHSGAVRLADRLVAAGYVERHAGADARSLTLTLTPSGRVVARRIRAAREGTLRQVFEELSGDQRAALGEICEQLIATLTRLRLEQRAAGGVPAGGALCRMCDFAACGRHEGHCPAARAAAEEAL